MVISTKTHWLTLILIPLLLVLLLHIPTAYTLPKYTVGPDNNFIFNTSGPSIEWASYMAQLCGRECREGSLVATGPQCMTPECFECTCDPTCRLLGTCCPTYDKHTRTHHYHILESKSENPMQWFYKLTCASPPLSTISYLTVKMCPFEWSEREIQDDCENPKNDSLDSITPFSDQETGIVFQNLHCAVCNGFQPQTTRDKVDTIKPNATEQQGGYRTIINTPKANRHKRVAHPWRIEIQCAHYQNLYTVMSQLEFYIKASQLPECAVAFKSPFDWPDKGAPIACREEFNAHRTQTERCKSDDSMLKTLCRTLPNYLALRVKGYRNIFCYMCQDRMPQGCFPRSLAIDSARGTMSAKKFVVTVNMGRLPPMYLLFSPVPSLEGGERREAEQEESCQPGQWRNEESKCVPASCSPGKILENSTCTTVIEDITGLAYKVRLVLVPLQEIDANAVERLLAIIDDILKGYAWKSEITTNILFAFCPRLEKNAMRHQGLLEISLSGFIVTKHRMPRDEFESKFTDKLLQNILEFSIKRGNQLFNVSLKVACSGEEMCQEYERLRNESELLAENYDRFANKKNHSFENCSAIKLPMSTQMRFDREFYRYTYSLDSASYIDLTPSLECPFVSLNMSSRPRFERGNLIFSVQHRDREIDVTNDNGLTLREDRLLVCLDNLNNVINEPEVTVVIGAMSYTESVILSISFYTEIICLLLSVLCLLIAVVTYLLFPGLRALPGLNNLCLCATLATAQICLLVTASFGTRGRLNSIHCLFHAAILHYSWLASFAWMNTCCVHMYRVFTSALGPGFLTEKKTFRHYCIYSFGIPLLIVILTIVATASKTHGASIGYSGDICFLDVTLSVLIPVLGFLLPFGVSVVVNLVLFCLTIAEMARVTRHTPSSNKSSSGVTTYVKLSTLTGVFIAVAAVSVFSRNAVLTLVSGPLAALQGVYIFFAFIFNSHVSQLYTEMCLGRQRVRTSSMTSSSPRTNKRISTRVSDV